MEPFYISKDNSTFTVIEKSTAKRGFAGKEASGRETENVIGYYSNFKNALNAVAKQKFFVNKISINIGIKLGGIFIDSKEENIFILVFLTSPFAKAIVKNKPI
jgi:hypothetical protein